MIHLRVEKQISGCSNYLTGVPPLVVDFTVQTGRNRVEVMANQVAIQGQIRNLVQATTSSGGSPDQQKILSELNQV